MDLLDAADVQERLLGQVVEVALQDRVERCNGLVDGHRLARYAGENLGDVEGLRQEALDLAGPVDDQAVLVRQLIEAQDGDDVLQLLVALQRLLDAAGRVVVTLTDDLGREDRRCRRQRVHGRVDAKGSDLTGQLRRCVEVREGRERRRVGVVVGGHVHRLQRRDRTTLGRRDPLLQLTHLVRQGRLVADGRWHPAKQRRHLGTGLHEAEDVVDEQKDILVLHVAEVLGHRQRRQRDTQAHARRLVHLTKDEGGLLVDAGLHHLQAKVGALTRPLTDASEHRDATVVLGDTTDHLGDQHGLADAGTTEQTDLAALHVRREQVDDLDAGLEHLRHRLQRIEVGRRAMDVPRRQVVGIAGLRIKGNTPRVPDVAEHLVADRDVDAASGVAHRSTALETVGRAQADGADATVAEVLSDLGEDGDVAAVDRDRHLDGHVDLGQRAAGELGVDHGAGDGDDPAIFQLRLCHRHVMSPSCRSSVRIVLKLRAAG